MEKHPSNIGSPEQSFLFREMDPKEQEKSEPPKGTSEKENKDSAKAPVEEKKVKETARERARRERKEQDDSGDAWKS